MRGGNADDLIYAIKKIPDLHDYNTKNIIETCELNNDEKKCSTNKMCIFKSNECKMGLTKDYIVTFINRLTDEILADEYKLYELINKDKYSIYDVNDYYNFTNRNKQKIIKSNSVNITELLHFLKNQIVKFKTNLLKDNIKSKLINIITNTEAKLLERGDEFINILYILSSINIEIKDNT